MRAWPSSTLASPIDVFRFLLLTQLLLLTHEQSTTTYHDYCVIGAGPAGLQMGYFLKAAGRDYIVFEKSNITGNAFLV